MLEFVQDSPTTVKNVLVFTIKKTLIHNTRNVLKPVLPINLNLMITLRGKFVWNVILQNVMSWFHKFANLIVITAFNAKEIIIKLTHSVNFRCVIPLAPKKPIN